MNTKESLLQDLSEVEALSFEDEDGYARMIRDLHVPMPFEEAEEWEYVLDGLRIWRGKVCAEAVEPEVGKSFLKLAWERT